jgi:glycosyl transferase family 25
MKIKVISLRDSKDRRANITHQFTQLGTPFEFFDAITPDKALEHVEGYDRREFFRNCGRYATKPEIACFASHLALWRECAAGQTPFLILEDDAKLKETFATGFLVAASQIETLGFLRISSPELKSSTPVNRLGPFEIRYCRRVPLLALGYALSPQTALQLTRAAQTVEEPVDKFLQRFWRHGQPVFAVTPPFVSRGPLAADSDIGARTRHAVGTSVWLQRAIRKMQNTIQRTAFNVTFSPLG